MRVITLYRGAVGWEPWFTLQWTPPFEDVADQVGLGVRIGPQTSAGCIFERLGSTVMPSTPDIPGGGRPAP